MIQVVGYQVHKKWRLIGVALYFLVKKHVLGWVGYCVVPAPRVDNWGEARRQNRNTRPALTKHTPIAHQRSNGVAGTKKNVKRRTVKPVTMPGGAALTGPTGLTLSPPGRGQGEGITRQTDPGPAQAVCADPA
ncbi:hypothetical protein ACVGXS_24860, partial [Enterobacter hormaechei]